MKQETHKIAADPDGGGWIGIQSGLPDFGADGLETHFQQAITFDAPELFRDYVQWLDTLGRRQGLDGDKLRAAMNTLATRAPDGVPAVRAILDVGRQALDSGSAGTPEMPEEGEAFGDWRRRYLGFLLSGLRKPALDVLRQAALDGVPVDRIYLDILAPTLREIGWLWQIGRVTVAQEHFATAVTQFAMANLYDQLAASNWNGRTVVVANPGDERHEVGARMVADLMDQAGWNAVFLGAKTPVEELPEALLRYKADVLALSCTMTPHLADVRAAIEMVRSNRATAGLPVLVGGRPFTLSDALWQRIGADAVAHDAAEAARAAERLLDEGGDLRRPET